MANGLWNAGFLEQTTRWATAAGATLNVDEDGRGAPGRAVLRATKIMGSVGDALQLEPSAASRATVSAGDVVEFSGAALGLTGTGVTFSDSSTFDGGAVFAGVLDAGVPIAPRAYAVFCNAAGGVIAQRSLSVRPPEVVSHGLGVAGVRSSYYTFLQRETAPSGTASALLKVDAQSTAANQTVSLLLLKPFVGRVPSARSLPLPWDPGSHDGSDIGFKAWPEVLRPFRRGAGGEVQPGRVEYQSGAGRPKSRRIALDPVRKFVGQMRCDPVQRAVVEQFARSGPGDFWLVEPDTDRLCVASWAADGAPMMIDDRGVTCLMQVGLWLETA